MVRYFINYEDYIENKNINDIDLYYLKLFNKKKNKKGLYKIIPLINEFEIYNHIKKNNNKKNLMVELYENELKDYNDLLIKEYEEEGDNLYKKTFHNKEECVFLINYATLINMNISEIKKGNIVVLEPCISDDNYLYLSSLRLKEDNLNEKRNEITKKAIGADIYLYTNDKDILKKYEEGIVQVREKECNKYELLKNDIYLLDALKNNDLIGFDALNYSYLNYLNKNSIPVYVTENFGEYNISLKNEDYGVKKYLITNTDLKKMLKNSELYNLLKYINLYKLRSGKYEKSSVIKNENANILKYKRIDKK